MRLFSAIELPADVRAELAQHVTGVQADTDALTWSPAERWHITLGFYGDREHADRRGAWFRRRAATLRPARIRLRAAGRFPGVLWIGVNPADAPNATALRVLAGTLAADTQVDQHSFVPHVTLARWKRGSVTNEAATRAAQALADYRGRWWLISEVVLFRSDLTADGPVYTALDRVPLTSKQG